MQPRRQLMPVPLLAAALLFAVALLAGCVNNIGGGRDAAADQPPATGVTRVVAKDISFSPAAIQVPAGTTVTWSFRDGQVPHNVHGDGWGSGDPQHSGSYRHTFDRPGTYTYHCTLHPQMTGRVVVTTAKGGSS
jgi:plastocyanin